MYPGPHFKEREYLGPCPKLPGCICDRFVTLENVRYTFLPFHSMNASYLMEEADLLFNSTIFSSISLKSDEQLVSSANYFAIFLAIYNMQYVMYTCTLSYFSSPFRHLWKYFNIAYFIARK